MIDIWGSKMEFTYSFLVNHYKEGNPIIVDFLELIDEVKDSGYNISDFDFAIAISRVVKEGKIRYTLNGIKVIDPYTNIWLPIEKEGTQIQWDLYKDSKIERKKL